MSRPIFSIAVPTADRPETLRYTLDTLKAIEGDDFEVVISDNCGPDENRRLCEEYGAFLNLVYIRQSERISMRLNFEAAVQACSGEYITVIGDDDGMVKNSLSYARNILSQSNPDIIFWFPHMYWWPTALIESKRNFLYLNLKLPKVHVVNSFEYVDNFFTNQKNYWLFEKLPSIYNAFVSRRIIQLACDRYGAYFNDDMPDVYSGILNGVLSNSTVFIERPLSIRGISAKSNGVAFRNKKMGSDLVDEFKKMLRSPFCEMELVDSSALAVLLASVRLRAIKSIQELSKYSVNIPDVIVGILSEVNEDANRYEDLIDDAKKLAQKYKLNLNGQLPDKMIRGEIKRSWGISYNNEFPSLLTIDGYDCNLRNIYDASKIVNSILS